jgi:accessory colonization factor AcfC
MLNSLLAAAILGSVMTAGAAQSETVQVYGPGGPAPAMQEAAATFQSEHGVAVKVVSGPTPSWLSSARNDADMIYSGSETMMTDLVNALGGRVASVDVVSLYMRPSAILVRPGNPQGIRGIRDLLVPGRKILIVNGSGQNGLWEDVAGRLGNIETVRAFRANIKTFAQTSADAKQAWINDPSLDAWLIWDIWQVANPQLADAVAVEPEYRIFRDMGAVLSTSGKQKQSAQAFFRFLQSPRGRRIFEKWGWMPGAN